MRFWDSSAVIPLCVHELQTERMTRFAEEDNALVVWWGTPVECYAALTRRRREEILSSTDEEQARRVLSLLIDRWTEIEPSRDLRETAMRILRLHPLRGADSLQLAAALVWANAKPTGHEFICLDQRLRDAASREGFKLLPNL